MGLWGTRPLSHRAHHPEMGKIRQEGRQEGNLVERLLGSITDENKSISLPECACLARHSEFIVSQSKMSHLSSAHPELWSFNCIG